MHQQQIYLESEDTYRERRRESAFIVGTLIILFSMGIFGFYQAIISRILISILFMVLIISVAFVGSYILARDLFVIIKRVTVYEKKFIPSSISYIDSMRKNDNAIFFNQVDEMIEYQDGRKKGLIVKIKSGKTIIISKDCDSTIIERLSTQYYTTQTRKNSTIENSQSN